MACYKQPLLLPAEAIAVLRTLDTQYVCAESGVNVSTLARALSSLNVSQATYDKLVMVYARHARYAREAAE